MFLKAPVITGTGIICAAGCGVSAVWEAVRRSESGLRPLTLFASTRYGKHLVGEVQGDVDRLAGPVRGSRSDKLAWIAAQQALSEAGITRLDEGLARRTGIVVGATVGGMRGTEKVLEQLLAHNRHRFGAFRFHECASSVQLCARMLGVQGPCATISTACSAGAMALAVAAELLEAGDADLVLAGGADALCRLTLNGFGSLLLLDQCGCRPFDARRTGISLGEGAAMLVVEAEEHALRRGARVLARLSGWGGSCDAWHSTAPHPEGRGAFAAMEQAFRSAELEPDEIDFVSAHGTGTPDNDAMEAAALRRLFGDRLPPVCSVKRFFGHTLAASGAIKAVLAVRTLMEQSIPPSLGFEERDPAVGFEPVRHYTECPVTHVLSNSFGFGGNNVTLVFSRAEQLSRRRTSPNKAASKRFAIAGAGVISAAAGSVTRFLSVLSNGAVPVPEAPAATGTKTRAYVCGGFEADTLDPGRKRRLSRFQLMALVAAKQSLEHAGVMNPQRVCVGFGTGFGSLNDTAAFLENMILKEERAPRPLFFTNSVHNTLAAQIAMEFGFQGTNSTPVQREISFEVALWQMTRELDSGRGDFGLAGAADELSAYQLMAGTRWKWWNEGTAAIAPFAHNLRSGEQPLPGEGCGCVLLRRGEDTPGALGHLNAIALGSTGAEGRERVNAVPEARWLQAQLERQGMPLESVDLLLTGANGGEVDSIYAAVARELSRLAGRLIPCGAYKQWCGEFASASAIGFVVALGLVRGEIPTSACLPPGLHGELDSATPRQVLLYTLARDGTKSMCGVTA